MATVYNLNATTELAATFTNEDDELTDPTTVSLSVLPPDGDQDDYTGGQIDNPSVGLYTMVLLLDQPGRWHWRFTGTGDVEQVKDGYLIVKRSKLT